MEKLNLAVIGSGYWGSKIVDTLKNISTVNEIQVIDVKNGQTVDDINSNITAAIIATPVWDHKDTARELLLRNFDCYIEKPMAESCSQISDIWDCVDQQICMVGHIFLYHPALEYIKANLHKLGTIKHIRSERLNWGIYQTKTTPLLSLLPHDVSILLDFYKDLEVVSASQKNFTANNVPDYVSVELKNENITATITGSWYWPERVRRLIIIGTDGHIVWDDTKNTIEVFLGKVIERRLTDLHVNESFTPDLSISPLQRELRHFVDCVLNRTKPISDIANAFDVAKILDDAQAKLNQG